MVNKRCCNDFICAALPLWIILFSEYYYVPIQKINLCCCVEILIFEVMQSIFLQSRWEWRTQWSQRSRPVVIKRLISLNYLKLFVKKRLNY